MRIDEKAHLNLEPRDDIVVRNGTEADVDNLMEIAKDAYIQSRYFFDRGFSEEHCRLFYQDWIAKSCRGEFDDVVIVAEKDGKIAGYVSCKKATRNLGTIGLVGVSSEFRGQNVGQHVLARAISWFYNQGLPKVTVATQGRNIVAQKLYQRAGFTTLATELWYHKWFAKNYFD